MSDLYDQAFNQLAAVIDKAAGQGEETLAEGLHAVLNLMTALRVEQIHADERDIAANYAAQLRQLSNDLGQAAGNIEETLRRDGA
jgi:iron-sulfur cluster repair protein YtfE (RIC family)